MPAQRRRPGMAATQAVLAIAYLLSAAFAARAVAAPPAIALAGSPESSPATPVESGYVEAGGGRIFYEAAGSGPVIVFSHDGLLHRETWDAPFAALAPDYRVVRYDRRGYGRSDAPKEPFSNLDDLAALFDALKIEKAAVIGCSYGSLLSIDFALEHPDRVAALVLVGPIVTGLSFSEHFGERGRRGKPADDAPIAQRIDYWSGKDPWIVAPGSSEGKATMRRLLTANPQNLSVPWPLVRGPGRPALPLLPRIKVPTLLIAGESDIPDVHTHIGAIEAGIAGSRRIVLSGSGHLPQIEIPGEFNRVVSSFLAKAYPAKRQE